MRVVARLGSMVCVDAGDSWIVYDKEEKEIVHDISKVDSPHYDVALLTKWNYREKDYAISKLSDLDRSD